MLLSAFTPKFASAASPAMPWTGFYIGANAGYGWGTTTDNLIGYPPFNWAIFNIAPGVPATFDHTLGGFIGGGQAGYNFQTGSFVFGVEGDFSFSNIHDDLVRTGLDGIGTYFEDPESQKLKWLATVRGRVGIAATNQLLIFATGGYAVGSVYISTAYTYPFSITYSGDATTTKSGWTAGGGAEYALGTNWSVKLEYLYVDLGKASSIGTPKPPNGNLHTEATVDTRVSIVRIGINYRFGGP